MSIFSDRILLATDGSEDAVAALALAIDLCRMTGCELHVLTVTPGYPSRDPAYPSYKVNTPEAAEELLRKAEEILENQLTRVEHAGDLSYVRHLRIAEGTRAAEIVRLARDIRAGLIVLGRRGMSGKGKALAGGVSDSVVRHASCPVLIVRGDSQVRGVISKGATAEERERA